MTVVPPSNSSSEVEALLLKVEADSTDDASRRELARLYVKEHQIVEAERWFAAADSLAAPAEEELAERSKLLAETYLQWANALHDAKDFDSSAKIARDGLQRVPQDADLRYALGRALLKDGRFREAAEAAAPLVTSEPKNGKFLRLHAEALRLSGHPRQAVDLFARVETDDPAFVQNLAAPYRASYYNGWGRALFFLRRYAEAGEKFATAARTVPDDPVYWNNLGAAHYLCEEWYEAVDAYKEALRLSPFDPMATPGLAVSEWRAGLIADAERDFDKAKRVASGTLLSRIMHCLALWRVGRYRDARLQAHELRARFRELRREGWTDTSDYSEAAEVFATMLGDFECAEEALAAAVPSEDDALAFVDHQLSRAVVLYARADRDVHDRKHLCQLAAAASRAATHRLLKHFADRSSDTRVDAELQMIGRAYLLLDRLDEARKYLDEAVQRSWPMSETFLAHAMVALEQKDCVAAIHSLDAALSRDTEDVSIRVLLADALHRAGDLDRAETEARAVLSRAPGMVEAHLVLANVSIDLGEKGDSDLFVQALAELDRAWQLTGTIVGSKAFSPVTAATICYLRGYVRTRIYNSQTVKDESLLTQALDDFRKSLGFEPENHHAMMALRKMEQRRGVQRASWINDRLAGGTCLAFALAILGTSVNRLALGYLSPGYAALFIFGSMLFLIASFYLPQLIKLKVGSIELEKASADAALAKLPLQIRKMQAFGVSNTMRAS